MDELLVEVDTKEPHHIYEEAVYQSTSNPNFEGIRVVKRGLLLGDLKCKNFGVERKEMKDFVESIHDGRVFKQIHDMVLNYDMVHLMVSGNLASLVGMKKHNSDSIYDDKDVRAILTTCADFERRYNIKIDFMPNDEYLIHYFLTLCTKYAKDLKPLYKLFRPELNTDDEAMLVLMGIKHVGEKTADSLLNWGSIQEIANCNPNILSSIDGARIGEKSALHIHKVLTSKRIKKSDTTKKISYPKVKNDAREKRTKQTDNISKSKVIKKRKN